MNALAAHVRATGRVPLAWAGGTTAQDYLNLGDALSPVMVALLSGRPVERVPFVSDRPRLAAVGTVGQNLKGGDVWFWGTGCGEAVRGSDGRRRRYVPDPAMRARVAAARGPFSAARLSGYDAPAVPYADPVWLLPRFHHAPVEKRWELGVIVHLSELEGRGPDCAPREALARYRIPEEFADSVRILHTVTGLEAADLGARVDEIRACKRLLSTSLHGLVFAESYAIPCLTVVGGEAQGLRRVTLEEGARLDGRMLDLYAGCGRKTLPVLALPHDRPTDWAAAIAAVDRAWSPSACDADALAEALPVDLAPIEVAPGESIWRHPLIAGLPFREDVRSLRARDAEAAAARRAEGRRAGRVHAARLGALGLPSAPHAAPARLRLPLGETGPEIPLVWAAGAPGSDIANVGDALSPMIVAAMSGLTVRHAAAVSEEERLAGIGTIGQSLAGGTVHLWGTGLDTERHPTLPGRAWSPAPDTDYRVHAVRGPFTAGVLRRHGIAAPEVFGDPVYLLPRLWPFGDVEKTHDLGVVLHLSELEHRAPGARPRAEHRRYHMPPEWAGRVKIIDMYAEASAAAFERKVVEILSCRRILSTSLHGLVIPDAYGVPSAWFGLHGRGPTRVDLMDPGQPIDHRMRDLYAGLGLAEAEVFAWPREVPTDWAAAIEATEGLSASGFDASALLAAFPGPLACDRGRAHWSIPPRTLDGVVL